MHRDPRWITAPTDPRFRTAATDPRLVSAAPTDPVTAVLSASLRAAAEEIQPWGEEDYDPAIDGFYSGRHPREDPAKLPRAGGRG